MHKLESVQLQSAYAVLGAWRGGSSRDKVYDDLGWEWLSHRRWYRRMSVFYKIVNRQSPKYLTDSITFPDPPWISCFGRQVPTLSSNLLTPIVSRTQTVLSVFSLPVCFHGTGF